VCSSDLAGENTYGNELEYENRNKAGIKWNKKTYSEINDEEYISRKEYVN
jgi:hypothetical protein